MIHSAAKSIFKEIQNRPYAWSTTPGVIANNCYFKGIELLQRLAILGYAVRGQVGDTFLDPIIPRDISSLYPTQFKLTHFWVEILINNDWHKLDASYDPPLERAGFMIADWNSNRTCFEITKTYTQEELILYQSEWAQPAYAEAYFKAIAPCANALNEWYQSFRE